MKIDKKQLLILLAFFSIYFIWGSTYLLNKIAVSEIPAFSLAAVRFLTAGSLILGIAKILKKSLRISIKQLLNAFIAGFLFLVYGNGVFVWALNYIDSGFAALLASTQPLFVLLLMRLIDGKRMQIKSIIGVTLGMFGMYLLVSQKGVSSKEGSLFAIIVMFSCVLSWSYGSIFVSKADLPKNFFDKNQSGQLINRITFTTTQVSGAASNAIKTFIREGFLLIGLLAYMLTLNWKLTLLLLINIVIT